MKIIGGQAKGRKIYLPKGVQCRATTDRTKEALFNILPSMEGKTFLDLFAGTGNIGIEALSRGVEKAVFVEKNTLLVKAVKENLNRCGLKDKYTLIASTVENGIRMLAKRKEQFDIIFADPPYMKGFIQKTLNILSDITLISENGIIVMEHSYREKFKSNNNKIILVDQKRYGDTMITFFEVKGLS